MFGNIKQLNLIKASGKTENKRYKKSYEDIQNWTVSKVVNELITSLIGRLKVMRRWDLKFSIKI